MLIIALFPKINIGQIVPNFSTIKGGINQSDNAFISDSSIFNQESEQKGIKLFDFYFSSCLSDGNEKLLRRVSGRRFLEDTLDVEIAVVANCCPIFRGEIQVINDTTLNLIYADINEGCFCSCCFSLTYRITTSQDKFRVFLINGKQVLETDRMFKTESTEEEFYDNGAVKSKTFMLEGEIQVVKHFDANGKAIRVDQFSDGVLKYSVIDGKIIYPEDSQLNSNE